MVNRLGSVVVIAVLLALPASSAVACVEMLASTDDCPMEQGSTQPTPEPAKTSCCYVSAVEPAVGSTPVKLVKAVVAVVPQVVAAPAPAVVPQTPYSLHGSSPGHGSSLQQLFCVFRI
ncbi:MAG: hypothetical protein ACREUQ_01855 [Burkholderiales bacterium]